ncbi:MAG TPA: hydroxymethylglutaryl-CoA lyase [Chthoniobacterales bacterium]|jgi:hydroxymethylglutaryl-CoA lyase
MAEPNVKLIECPRDAWQGLPKLIPTELKVRYLNGLIEAGFRHLDAVSFVSTKAVPQMADSERVLAQLDVPNELEIIGIVVNERGAERAIATGKVSSLGYPCSISPAFLRRNQNQSPEENWEVLQRIRARAAEGGLKMVVYLSMAFGNPYGDTWSTQLVADTVRRLRESGVREISLADTVGVAGSSLVGEVVRAVVGESPNFDLGVHLHSSPGSAADKVLTAFDAGCRRFDAALGGLGGCPFAQSQLVGNVATEEVLRALESRGVTFPMAGRLQEVSRLNAEIEELTTV